MAVSARGRIPASVVEQYQAATKGHWHTPRSRPAKPRPDHPWPQPPANSIRPSCPPPSAHSRKQTPGSAE